MPGQPGRVCVVHGEAVRDPISGEACGPLLEHPDTGSAKLKAGTGGLLEGALTRHNHLQAAHWMCTHWPQTRQALLAGTYRPQPVRKVMIPKPDRSPRELGIPTVIDRLIQQALLQVLQPRIDPTLSNHSHGLRPGRRAHDAVKAARNYVQSGKRVMVDVDLEKFFDRVNHDILIDRLRKRINDAAVIRLIRAYLNAGIMDGGVVSERHLGTPQGGPVSPLLAKVLLDEVDKELEARGYSFARYADDCNIYVGSVKAGERVMALPQDVVRQTQASDQLSQKCGGQRLRAQVPGLRAVGGQGPGSQMCSGPQGAGQLQSPHSATHAPLGWAQHGASGRETEALHTGLQGVLRAGANAHGLAKARRVVAPPIASHPTQALEEAKSDLPRTQGAGGNRRKWRPGWQATVIAGGATATGSSRRCSPLRTSTGWGCHDCHNLKLSNRPVRARMPGGVAEAPPTMETPYADVGMARLKGRKRGAKKRAQRPRMHLPAGRPRCRFR